MSKSRETLYISLGVGALFYLLSQQSASAQTSTGSNSTTSGLLGILNNLTKPKPGTPASASKPSSGSGSGNGGGLANSAAALKAKAQAMLAAIGKASANGYNTPVGTSDDFSGDLLGLQDSPTLDTNGLYADLSGGLDNSTVTTSQTDNSFGDFGLFGGGGGIDRYGNTQYVPYDSDTGDGSDYQW